MPMRLSGSAAERTISLPSGVSRRTSRRRSIASGQRELFAAHAVDETSAADLAARLEAAVHARELAPRRGVRLAGEHAAEHDAVAAQQHARLDLDGVVGCAPVTIDQRPAKFALRVRVRRACAVPRSRPRRSDPRRPARRGLRRRCRGRGRNEAPRVRSVSSTVCARSLSDDLRFAAQRLPRIRVLAQEQRDRRRADDARLPRRESRAQPTSPVRQSMSSSDGSYASTRDGRTERSHAAAAISKPSSCAITACSPSMPDEPRRRRDVLPREEEAHEVRRADGLDLRAQAIEGVAMDAREQSAVAPLDSAR